MIELDKNFAVQISQDGGIDKVTLKLASPAAKDAVVGLTPQQCRALSVDLIKAAYLAENGMARYFDN